MKDLITAILKALVDQPEEVSVNEIGGSHTIVLEVSVAKTDRGVCEPALKLQLYREGCMAKCHGRQSRLAGEIRPSGMKTGARGNVTHGGTRNPIRNRKSGIGHSSPTGARALFLSKQSPCPDPARGRGGQLPRATLQLRSSGTSEYGG